MFQIVSIAKLWIFFTHKVSVVFYVAKLFMDISLGEIFLKNFNYFSTKADFWVKVSVIMNFQKRNRTEKIRNCSHPAKVLWSITMKSNTGFKLKISRIRFCENITQAVTRANTRALKIFHKRCFHFLRTKPSLHVSQ